MPRIQWPLWVGRPCIEVILTLIQGAQPYARKLLADTGAGSLNDPFELILDEDDCLHCGGTLGASITLGGAYSGSFPVYELPVKIPALGFDQHVRAVGVPSIPVGFDGIACFSFLNRFTYSNFADPGQFGLEC